MWDYVTPDELYHYGVKGMKWGCTPVSESRRQFNPSWKKTYWKKV